MKKVRGKALALVLSLALVVSSFSTAFTSAASRTLKGKLTLTGGDDEFYFVNGENNTGKPFKLGEAMGAPELETPDHEDVSDEYISDISHKSGDHLVKWFDDEGDKESSIDDDTDYNNVAIKLRNASSSGTEVLSVLYSGTYTDDDDKEYTVKASKDVTVRVYDENEVVLGESSKNNATDVKGEYTDNFAQKTTEFDEAEKTFKGESKTLTALKATVDPDSLYVKWEALPTAAYNDTTKDLTKHTTSDTDADDEKYADTDYLLDSSSGNLQITDGTHYIYKYAVGDAAVTDPAQLTKTATDNKITLEAADKAAGKKLSVGAFDGDELVGSIVTFTAAAGEKASVSDTDSLFKLSEDGKTLLLKAAATDGSTYKVGETSVTDGEGYTLPTGIKDNDTITVTKSLNGTNTEITVTYKAGTADGYQTAAKDDASKKPGIAVDAEGNVTVDALTPPTGNVTVSVKEKAGASSITLTLKATQKLKDADKAAENGLVADTDDVDLKTKIEKKILVKDSNFHRLGKDGTNTYVYSGSLDDASEKTGNAIKANGFEVKFDKTTFTNGIDVTVDDKANVSKISGKLKVVSVDGDSSVGEIDPDDIATEVNVSEAKVGDINFDDDEDEYAGTVKVDSYEAEVGNINDAKEVDVTNGKVGNIDASDTVDIKADDDDHSVTVGDVSTKTLSIDSEDSQGIKTGTLTASDDDAEFTLTGSAVTVGGIDFDYYNTELKLDDFQGEIPAPKNATNDDATLSTNNEDDKVTVKGDADISNISLNEESQIAFDGALNVGSVDGSGKLVVAPGKLNVTSDASSDVQLVLSGATLNVGDVAYTSTHDSIDEDSFDNYGFTVTKTEGSSKDTFKIASLKFTGLTIAPASTEIAKGQSQTFTASAYAPGSAIPEGYTIKFDFDGNDQYFDAVDNGDGTATVTVKGLDDTFASENKATLTAHLEDADGATDDDYDEGEADIKAVAVPATNFKSDTTGYLNLKVGQTYQFKITSTDGTAPTFGVAGNGATVQYAGATGSDYFYKVTGAKEGSYGVYVNGGGVEHRAAILVIKGVNVTTDTTAVTKAPGQTYQFKITAPSQPNFVAVGLKSVLASKSGNNYFYKVTASNVKGGHGIYVNGVRVAIFTVA